FPDVIVIDNKVNLGFSKANNQAMRLAKGKYVLLLNPDTVVEEDTFRQVIDFMNENPDAGGLGVRMIDGKGRFLPESKRGIPTPAVAFYKIFGLSSLFPKSKKFGRYHLGYLSETEVHEIEILSGAFMLMRKETLDKVGLLDEDFFMYGEDIDLSYRIILGGYKNYYFPTKIIHYKGESTKKSSVNYVFVFYNAMIIFAKKHFSQKNAKLFSLAINFAIYFRASLAIFTRLVKRSILPIIDFLSLIGGAYLLTHYWQEKGIYFPEHVTKIAIPAYVLTWMLSVLFQGGYDKVLKVGNYLKGIVYATGVLLIVYALLPKEYQFSRLFILAAALWAFSYYLFSRLALQWLFGDKFKLAGTRTKKFIIVGTPEESQRVEKLIRQTANQISTVYFVSSEEQISKNQIGRINQLDSLIKEYKIDEIIFCAKDCSASVILEWMNQLNNSSLDFKIAQPDTVYLIGSNSIETSGDLYMLNINQINSEKNIRYKRLFDIFGSLILTLGLPISIWFFKNKRNYIQNLISILLGKKSFVGYITDESKSTTNNLPLIKKGILTPDTTNSLSDKNTLNKVNLIYARDYSISKDLKILLKNFKKLDH
ncbi:MAG TPA: glycosyltransferase, partial [Crocinitomicaceae bacterium]|nr:glycosyltransferase [Crocinitomicaceae bacterium]